MELKKRIKSFVRETKARIKGDGPSAIAEKNYRMADAALSTQIAVLSGKVVKDETLLTKAQEALNAAKYPTDEITDMEQYIEGIKIAQDNVNAASKSLKATEESIAYYKSMKADNDSDGEEEESESVQ